MDLVDRAQALAKHCLSNELPRRWRHTEGVAQQATDAARSFGPDGEVLVAAAWLHDVGYSPQIAMIGFHPLDGARFLRQQGWDERVCALVAHHSCAVREARLRGCEDQLTAEFADEESALRDALWYADMTTDPDGRAVLAVDRLSEIASRYGPGDIVTMFIEQARDDLIGAVDRTTRRLAESRSI
ncbi:MAG: HD domain-containing protein [Mycobacteriaceae bacterium]|nr:HD domain-containing protein [Mycobacteriaceae bacterium]